MTSNLVGVLKVLGGCAVAALGLGILPAAAQTKPQIVVASYGGRLQDTQREVYFAPFTQAHGINVVDTTGITLAKVKTMVATKNVEWDVFLASQEELEGFAAEGLLEKMDFGKLDKTVIAELDPRMVHPYGIGSQYYGAVIAYNTKRFKGENAPGSWQDVWDTTRFPGPRILPAASYQLRPIEPALLADGVPPGSLYPLDLDRAYASLSKIRPNVIKWVSSGNAAPQALVDGEADIAIANHARIAQLREEGAPVDYTWNGAVVTASFWVIPKGAKNYDAALKFIEFASREDNQIALASKMPYGPANAKAAANLPAEKQKDNPVAPQNASKIVFMDAASWAAKPDGKPSALERNLEKWNSWIRR